METARGSEAQVSVVDCHTLFDSADLEKRGFARADYLAGVVIGSFNDVVITLTRGGSQPIPHEIAKWMPLFNEIANVLSHVTGREWIYSGSRKRFIDGVALGSIVGQTLTMGVQHGPLAGALNFAVTYGLTYWFPNNHFSSVLKGVPKLFPERLARAAKSPVGQGVIGISLIVLIEKILEGANHQIVQNTGTIASGEKSGMLDLQHLLALFILLGDLPDSDRKMQSLRLLLTTEEMDPQFLREFAAAGRR